MAQIFYINDNLMPRQESDIKVCLFSGEGPIPHVHIVTKGKRDACVKLQKAEYFAHGSKLGKISTDTAILLDKMFRKIRPNGKGTFWEYVLETWNNNNPRHQISETLAQPDYTKLNA